jgi:hypothetical protein
MPDPFTVTNGMYTKQMYTVTALPAAASCQGEVRWVSDMTENRNTDLGKTVSGGGSFKGRVISDGTNWKVHGSIS